MSTQCSTPGCPHTAHEGLDGDKCPKGEACPLYPTKIEKPWTPASKRLRKRLIKASQHLQLERDTLYVNNGPNALIIAIDEAIADLQEAIDAVPKSLLPESLPEGLLPDW